MEGQGVKQSPMQGLRVSALTPFSFDLEGIFCHQIVQSLLATKSLACAGLVRITTHTSRYSQRSTTGALPGRSAAVNSFLGLPTCVAEGQRTLGQKSACC